MEIEWCMIAVPWNSHHVPVCLSVTQRVPAGSILIDPRVHPFSHDCHRDENTHTLIVMGGKKKGLLGLWVVDRGSWIVDRGAHGISRLQGHFGVDVVTDRFSSPIR